MNERYCSLGDRRSWTELVTNYTSLGGVDLDRDMESLLGWGTAPKALLPALVHEATHHWCFLSPVGFVLAHLQLRARRRAALLRNGLGENLLGPLLGDVIRYETAAAMLRPLAEGLALFAEFDAVPGSGASVTSLPATLVATFFGDWTSPTGVHGLWEWSSGPLREWRNGEACARRKESVLGHGFEFTEGGYLPGYLTVRKLWVEAAKDDRALLNHSDLFLTFLRAFFYHDPALVDLLLDDSPPSRDVAEAIIVHIADRFDKVQQVTKEQVSDFENFVALEPGDREASGNSDLMNLFTNDRSLLETTRQAIDDLLAQVANPDLNTVEGLLAIVGQRTLSQRDIIHLGSQTVEVSVDGHGECAVKTGDKIVHVGRSVPGVQAGTASGRLDLVFSILPGHMARGSMIYRGDDLVALSINELQGDQDEAAKSHQRFEDIDSDPERLRAACEEMQEQLDIVLDWEPLDKLVAEMRQLANDMCEGIYELLALQDVPPDRRSHLAEVMRESGLMPLLRWDRDIIYGLVLISISWSLRLERPEIIQKLAEYGLDLDKALQAIAEIAQEYNIPIITDGGNILFSSV
jgi:hypothetical protein